VEDQVNGHEFFSTLDRERNSRRAQDNSPLRCQRTKQERLYFSTKTWPNRKKKTSVNREKIVLPSSLRVLGLSDVQGQRIFVVQSRLLQGKG